MNALFANLGKNEILRYAVLGILLCVFIFIVLIPKQIHVQGISKEVDRLVNENVRIQNMILTNNNSGKKLQDIKIKLERSKRMIPPRETLSDVLDKIASLAQQNGLEVVSMRPVRDVLYNNPTEGILEDTTRKVFEVQIDIKAKGRFLGLGRYLDALENAPVKILVENVEFKNEETNLLLAHEEPQLGMELTIGILMLARSEEEAALSK